MNETHEMWKFHQNFGVDIRFHNLPAEENLKKKMTMKNLKKRTLKNNKINLVKK